MNVIHLIPHIPKFLKIGAIVFCLMCLFFAINMASKYEHQKTETEIHRTKAKELEEKIHELSMANRELLQIRHTLVQEKALLSKEIDSLQEKYSTREDWKITTEKN